MCSSASCTDPASHLGRVLHVPRGDARSAARRLLPEASGRGESHLRRDDSSRRARRALHLCIATLFVLTLGSAGAPVASAGQESAWADGGVATGGTIDNSLDDYTRASTDQAAMRIDWRDGFDQAAGHTMEYASSLASGAEFLNVLGPDDAAIVNGTLLSGSNDVVIFSTPAGIYFGSTAIVDVGTLVAIGADLTTPARTSDGALALTAPVINAGSIRASRDVLLYGSQVVNVGEIATPAGQLLMLGADAIHFLEAETIAEGLLDPVDFVALLGQSEVRNEGELSAREAALIGRRVLNTGHIEIDDGTLMMLAGDVVHLRSLGDPIVVALPREGVETNHVERPEDGTTGPAYAVENRGTVDAGHGRVRLAAADPLGWGLRQIAGAGGATPSIEARTIELAGGESGRVDLAGRIDASNREAGGVGGTIDVTGETIVLRGAAFDESGTRLAEGASLDASGEAGGGSIRVGGDEKGRGPMQRARGLIVAEGSEVRADAITEGDGGRVILFAEALTHVAGEVSARGGAQRGDGGFVETSGLERLSLETTPDVAAPQGEAGHWLIDPYSITLVAGDDPTPTNCPEGSAPCLDRAVEAILDPDFDTADFDGILRTIAPDGSGGIADPNRLSVALLVRALSVGTDVTLSTEAFVPSSTTPDESDTNGNITVAAPIEIPDGQAAPGTRATLTLLAARDIDIDAAITVGDASSPETTPDMGLSLVFIANDQDQRTANAPYGEDQLAGSVNIDADIRTGGGDVTARGISVELASGRNLETDGGNVSFQTGSIDRFGGFRAFDGNGEVTPTGTGIRIDGTIDTARPADDGLPGGGVSLIASSLNVQRSASGGVAPLSIEAGEVAVTGTVRTGGGSVSLSGGVRDTTFAGNVRLTGATVDTDGGALAIDANRLSPDDEQVATLNPTYVIDPDTSSGEGGSITLTTSEAGAPTEIRTGGGIAVIGSSRAQRIQIDGALDTTGGDDREDGLLGVYAGDESGRNEGAGRFGSGSITIGGGSATTLASGGVRLEARDVATDTSGGAVSITATGESDLDFASSFVGLTDTDAFVTRGSVRVDAERKATLARNTRLEAERVELSAAAIPTLLTDEERLDPDVDTRLVFDGEGGADPALGVRIHADAISIRTAAAYAPPDPDSTSDDLLRQRNAQADYQGLQLRSQDGSARPETLTIEQSAGLRLVAAYAGGTEEPPAADLVLSDVFGAAPIGDDGQTLTLGSYNGTLTLSDASGLNGEDSRATLNGGLAEAGDEAVLFDLLTPELDLEALTITSPGDLTIDDSFTNAIEEVGTLTFVAGRPTESQDTSSSSGTLTVEAGLQLAATHAIDLHGAASGFQSAEAEGGLVFQSPESGGTSTRLQADSISLRAGAGRDSQNGGGSTRPSIAGAEAVLFRDGEGLDFSSDGTQKSFRFRQDAAIDAAAQLPAIGNFFGVGTATGFGTAGERVDYEVRSDFGAVDLSGFAATNVQDVDITLIGNGITGLDGFVFDGRHVTLGGTTGFTYTQALADAFAPSNVAAAPEKELTLRSGSNGVGDLRFASGIVVRAPHVRLVAGDGSEGDVGSDVIVDGATFDLSDGTDERTFVFHEDATFLRSNLPNPDRFTTLPTVFAVRNDGGTIDWGNLDLDTLPLDLAGPARLVLEAANLTLRATTDLDLTAADGTLSNLRLRLRSDALLLESDGGSVVASRLSNGGPATGALPASDDAGFDGEHLLIEGFQAGADATTGNLSALAETEPGSGLYDLATARGPESITIDQSADIVPEQLIDRFDVAGHFARSQVDDARGAPIPTELTLSANDSITVAPDNVSGSYLRVGDAIFPAVADLRFGSGSYEFGDLEILTQGTITLAENVNLVADALRLEAGLLTAQPVTPVDESNPMGHLVFEGEGSTLTANQLTLRAGPTFRVTNPVDADRDGLRDAPTAGLATLELAGLQSLRVRNPDRASSLAVTSSGDLTTDVLLAALVEGGSEWDLAQFASIQAHTQVADAIPTDTGTALLANHTRGLLLGSDEIDARLTVVLAGTRSDPFSTLAGFEDGVELRSNQILLDATSTDAQVQLDDPNLRVVSRLLLTGFEPASLLDLVSSDPDALQRTSFEIRDDSDFSTTSLPRLDRHFERGFQLGSTDLITQRRSSLRFVEIGLTAVGADMTFTNALRNGSIGANLVLTGESPDDLDLTLAVTQLRPGVGDYRFASLTDVPIEGNPALELASFESVGFDRIVIPTFEPDLADANDPGTTIDTRMPFGVETRGDQSWGGELRLQETLSLAGRDLDLDRDVFLAESGAPNDTGLQIQTTGEVVFGGDLGTESAPLGFLHVFFDDDSGGWVRFSSDGDQSVVVDQDALFAALPLGEPNDPTDPNDGDPIRALLEALAAAPNLLGTGPNFDDGVDDALAQAGRDPLSPFATIGKTDGDLSFRSTNGGRFLMASGERLAVAGDLTLDHAGAVVTLGDVAASGPNGLQVIGGEIGLVMRNSGLTFLSDGSSTQDGGSAILANTIDFGGVAPVAFGQGKRPRFGVPDAFDPTLPAFLANFPVAEIFPDGGPLTRSAFLFPQNGPSTRIASPMPLGGSRSELTGSVPPIVVPIRAPIARDVAPLQDRARMIELGVDARPTEEPLRLARLEGGAIIDDLGRVPTNRNIPVSESRLDPKDAETAIAVYESLFGANGERSDSVRAALQLALDRYLDTTRARRVVGFELRRFIRNRPSTLLEAYRVLDQLDALFRYHRRLGLSPAEYRQIQHGWLEAIQPEGISLDELSEAIHPSRYVRGSDILDLFGP